jgi:cytochrome c biogenesis protein CcdA/thiol-disulfide isomerase/thioredoxin
MRPFGVAIGLCLSFTFAIVGLVYLIAALGLPNSLLRTVAIVVLIVFGISLLIPRLSSRLEAWLSRVTGFARVPTGDGFRSGLLVGGVLGFIYAPCAGPILAGVITTSAAQNFSVGRLMVALAYSLGSAIVLLLVMLAGRKLTQALSRQSGRLQLAMGAVMVLVALLMLGNYDTRFETAVAAHLPSFLVDPTQSLENSKTVENQISALRGHKSRQAGGVSQAAARTTLPNYGQAPEFVGTQQWFNTAGDRSLTLASLRGKVVLVDFWTYSCINCIRTLPYLNAWYAKYRKYGFTIVGVHTPEFPFEKSASNVGAAISQNGIHYPVVQDNNYDTWNAYNNQYWPAEYLIDAQGRVRLIDFGEGNYGAKEAAIRQLLIAAGAKGLGRSTDVHAQMAARKETTPESYLGSDRAQNFVNGTITPGRHQYFGGGSLPPDNLRYNGLWNITPSSAGSVGSATLALNFNAQRVFLVLGAPSHTHGTVRVLLDGKPIPTQDAGGDVHQGKVTVTMPRLYRLVQLPHVSRHTLLLKFSPGVNGYAFTFG